MKWTKPVLTASAVAFLPMAAMAQTMPNQEEMWRMIQAQQKQIETLQAELQKTSVQTETVSKQVAVAEEKIATTNFNLDNVVAAQGASAANGSPVSENGWWKNTQLGGYGELHYNGGDRDEVDFHRYVLYVGHQFNDRVRLQSEIELEHSISGEGQNGEVELEQAYIEFDLTDKHTARAGLFLIPVGLLNETHEPTTFFGVERNPIERDIIPTTWWEAGAGLTGKLDHGFSYDMALHSGLEMDVAGANACKIRDGRNKVSEASAESGAATGRVKWSGMPGVTLVVTGQFQQDVTQGALPDNVEATLLAANADVRKGPFGLRALYARWDLSGAAPEAIGRDEQYGWYVEPAYYFTTPVGEAGVFVRYNQWDTRASGPANNETEQYDIGFNYWPHKDVVLKADYQFIDAANGAADEDLLNLGLGFRF